MLPPVRVTPDVRDTVESVLREGGSLGEFIEASVLEAAAWRRMQAEFVARGEAAMERWRREGGGFTVDEVMDDLHSRLEAAKKRSAKRLAK